MNNKQDNVYTGTLPDQEKSVRIAMRISNTSIGVNVFLSVLKLFAGLFAHSGAMISDAVHSLSDVLSTVIVIIGIRISGKDSDEDHPYGHDRFECVASIILAVMLAVTGAGIGLTGIEKIQEGTESLQTPGMMALIAAMVSVVVKEGMFWYTKKGADRIHSGALMADAWHHRSDALSSVGSMLGIGAAMLGYPIFDPIASIAICLFIFKAAYEIFKDAVDKMVDKAVPEEVMEALKNDVEQVQGVIAVDHMTTRQFGSRYYVDIEIAVDGNLTVTQGHDIAEYVHNEIEDKYPEAKHVMVHVNPHENLTHQLA